MTTDGCFSRYGQKLLMNLSQGINALLELQIVGWQLSLVSVSDKLRTLNSLDKREAIMTLKCECWNVVMRVEEGRGELDLVFSLSELLTHELARASGERAEARGDTLAEVLELAHIHGGGCFGGDSGDAG
jgi:hypothetical protein